MDAKDTDCAKKRNPWKLVLFSIVSLLLLLLFLISHGRVKPIHPREKCSTNLKNLVSVMFFYTGNEIGRFPATEKWCDFLAKRDDISAKGFLCPAAEEGPCTFALNPDGIGGSDDVVLFFESGPGWNQVGGAELLTTEYHEGRGCNIAFAGGHVRFVRSEDISGLRWKGD